MKLDIDIDKVHRAIEIIHGDNTLFEFRYIAKNTYNNASGYFTDINTFVGALQNFRPVEEGNAYIILNEINSACGSRTQRDKIIKTKNATRDNDVIKYKWFFVDCDPKRPSDISSTDEELKKAAGKSAEIYKFLKERGFSEPIAAKSGNGYHLLYKVDFDNTAENKNIYEKALKALDIFFSDSSVDIDTSVYSPAQPCKLYGTKATKGADTPERPHRFSEIVSIPDKIETTDISKLKELSKLYHEPSAPARPTKNYDNSFDLETWLSRYGITVKSKSPWNDKGTKYILDHCVFDESHNGTSACIIQLSNGALSYACRHNSCSGKTWQDVRLLFEPDVYSTNYDNSKNNSKEKELYYISADGEVSTKAKTDELASLDSFFKSGYGLTDLTEEDYEPPRFFVDNLISVGLTAIVGASKVGKSTFTTQMCTEIACGGRFLGHKANKCGVVYFDLEESKGLIANRTLMQGYADISQKDLCVYHNIPHGYELNKNFLLLIDAIRKQSPYYELFVVDTIARASTAEKSNGGNAYTADVEIYKNIQKYAIENNIAIILITHDGKASDNTKDVTKKQNGSTGLPATADTTIFISRKGDDRTSDEGVYELTGRLFASAKETMIFDKTQLKWKAKTEVKDYLTRDPYISHILQIAPENIGGAVTVPYKKLYEDVTHFTYNADNRTAVNNIKSVIDAHVDELFIKHRIAVSVGARTSDGRGIRITRC